jgi:hypothetical protein
LRKLSGSCGLLGIGRTYTPLATLIVHLLELPPIGSAS